MSFFSCSYNFFRWTKVGNHTRFLDTQNIANQREVNSLGGDLYPTVFAPPFGTPRTVIFCRFLRSAGKQKIPISFGNQDFTAFCFSSKWCHQESNVLIQSPNLQHFNIFGKIPEPLNQPYAKFTNFR